MSSEYKIVMMGGTGAVGSEVVKALSTMPECSQLTLLGRSTHDIGIAKIKQYEVQVDALESYQKYVADHSTAICTLGVGQPSKVSREEFIHIDHDVVYKFAAVCKQMDVQHFSLLSSVGINSQSNSFYLRTKGKLVDKLKELGFKRLSIFMPSMILTPSNRYGFLQGILLTVWPWANPLLLGPLTKFRGISTEKLGRAIANNALLDHKGLEYLAWRDFRRIAQPDRDNL